MDEMELERYINSILDTEHLNLKKDVRVDKHKKKGDEPQNETTNRVVETNR